MTSPAPLHLSLFSAVVTQKARRKEKNQLSNSFFSPLPTSAQKSCLTSNKAKMETFHSKKTKKNNNNKTTPAPRSWLVALRYFRLSKRMNNFFSFLNFSGIFRNGHHKIKDSFLFYMLIFSSTTAQQQIMDTFFLSYALSKFLRSFPSTKLCTFNRITCAK